MTSPTSVGGRVFSQQWSLRCVKSRREDEVKRSSLLGNKDEEICQMVDVTLGGRHM